MADSMNLVTAQISFLPILRLLFGEDHDEDAAKISWTNRHDFLNVSITPIECSIICSRYLADRFILPLAEALNTLYARNPKGLKMEIQISAEDYIVIQVDGQGLDAGQRVLELTSPLAMAGISIFFITTYFSDYILVPFRSRRTVTQALQQRGFVFSQTADAFVSQLSPSSPTLPHGGRSITTSPFYENSAPTTPPAKDIPELQIRTFTKLQRHNISPLVDDSVRLANCAGSREYNQTNEEQLKNDLLQVLLSTSSLPQRTPSTSSSKTASTLGLENSSASTSSRPDFGAKFLSLTITAGEPISVLLERRLLDRLGESLLGAKSEDDVLIPITLDLRELPLDATGIVCGVAGRLAQGSAEGEDGLNNNSPKMLGTTINTEPVEISFLSTARAGTVIVKASQLEQALDALEYGMKRATTSST
ncbi:uncharacterized protein Z518_00726 [Rhinocladiella mackenziei CBS 650.93]|uniref:CASTOR ACT domain-containing protein n=1 Tax=Rhinocladiella mackenziei CBS 650.93 TaxID=1442369 RepID=A0A0D2JJM6_9EURO|nr:uncharacterized protein Z518_00726 [Rhinocladiella mackenziei CBS 650.93]KIX09645.1 hypothetical protein Z518_00726 [Rhinocladiella mackenziei CBS 650.93]